MAQNRLQFTIEVDDNGSPALRRFVGELDKVQAKAGAATGILARHGQAITAASTAYLAISSVIRQVTSAVEQLTVKFIAEADRLERLSRQFTMPVQQLSKLSFAAGQAGVDIGELAFAIRGMQRFLVEAQRPTSDAARILGLYGMSVKDITALLKKDGVAQLRAFLELFGGYEADLNRANAIMKIFQGRGQQIIQVLIEERGEFAANMAAVRGWTETQQKALSDLGDAWSGFSARLQEGVRDLWASIAPTITAIISAFDRLLNAGVGTGGSGQYGTLLNIEQSLQNRLRSGGADQRQRQLDILQLKRVRQARYTLRGGGALGEASTGPDLGMYPAAYGAPRQTAPEIPDFGAAEKGAKKAADAVQEYRDRMRELAEETAAGIDPTRKLQLEEDRLTRELEDLAKAAGQSTEGIREKVQAFLEATEVAEEHAKAIEKSNDVLADLRDKLDLATGAITEQDAKYRDLARTIAEDVVPEQQAQARDMVAQLKAVEDATKTLETVFQTLGDTVGDVFEGLILGTRDVASSLEALKLSLLKTLTNMVIDQAKQSITSAVLGTVTGGGGGGGGSWLGSVLGIAGRVVGGGGGGTSWLGNIVSGVLGLGGTAAVAGSTSGALGMGVPAGFAMGGPGASISALNLGGTYGGGAGAAGLGAGGIAGAAVAAAVISALGSQGFLRGLGTGGGPSFISQLTAPNLVKSAMAAKRGNWGAAFALGADPLQFTAFLNLLGLDPLGLSGGREAYQGTLYESVADALRNAGVSGAGRFSRGGVATGMGTGRYRGLTPGAIAFGAAIAGQQGGGGGGPFAAGVGRRAQESGLDLLSAFRALQLSAVTALNAVNTTFQAGAVQAGRYRDAVRGIVDVFGGMSATGAADVTALMLRNGRANRREMGMFSASVRQSRDMAMQAFGAVGDDTTGFATSLAGGIGSAITGTLGQALFGRSGALRGIAAGPLFAVRRARRAARGADTAGGRRIVAEEVPAILEAAVGQIPGVMAGIRDAAPMLKQAVDAGYQFAIQLQAAAGDIEGAAATLRERLGPWLGMTETAQGLATDIGTRGAMLGAGTGMAGGRAAVAALRAARERAQGGLAGNALLGAYLTPGVSATETTAWWTMAAGADPEGIRTTLQGAISAAQEFANARMAELEGEITLQRQLADLLEQARDAFRGLQQSAQQALGTFDPFKEATSQVAKARELLAKNVAEAWENPTTIAALQNALSTGIQLAASNLSFYSGAATTFRGISDTIAMQQGGRLATRGILGRKRGEVQGLFRTAMAGGGGAQEAIGKIQGLLPEITQLGAQVMGPQELNALLTWVADMSRQLEGRSQSLADLAKQQLTTLEKIAGEAGAGADTGLAGVNQKLTDLTTQLTTFLETWQPILTGLGTISSEGLQTTFNDIVAGLGTDGAIATAVDLVREEISKLKRRQHGGPVMAGQAYVVGEAGPELFVSGQGGHIVPRSGVNVGLSVHVGGTSPEQIADAVEREVRRRRPTLITELRAALR